MITLDDGRVWKRHINQIRKSNCPKSTEMDDLFSYYSNTDAHISKANEPVLPECQPKSSEQQPEEPPGVAETTGRERPKRNINLSEKLKDYKLG